jgi:branched-chain amino acid aminotransferase
MIIYNGALVAEDAVLKVTNRAYQYGDALFETIKWSRGKALFWDDHYLRLLQSMAVLKMEVPLHFSAQYLHSLIQQLVKANSCDTSARIRSQVYRADGGYYLPAGNEIGFSITAEPLAAADYVLNDKPLHLGIYNDCYKTTTDLSSIKSANGLLYIMASLYAKEKGFDDCFLINEKGHVIETTNANIFIVKDNLLITPPLSDGCLNGILRKQVLKFALKNQIEIKEQSLTVDEVLGADEIILTNTIGGIRLVKCTLNLDWLPALISQLNN